MAIKLIIGLGNPGSAYEQTRHNAGAWFTVLLGQHYQCQFKIDKKMQAELAEFKSEKHAIKLAVPITFMNHSGQPTRAISQFYRIQPEEILVAHDELDLPVGTIRLKTGGGHGGHNGLKDIITLLGSPNFHRLRVGIGHPGDKDLVHSYVLNKPSVHDKQQMISAIERAIDVAPLIIEGNISQAMNQLNS